MPESAAVALETSIMEPGGCTQTTQDNEVG